MVNLRQMYLDFLVQTAQRPGRGFQIFAWHRAKELHEHPTLDTFRCIHEDLAEAMRKNPVDTSKEEPKI